MSSLLHGYHGVAGERCPIVVSGITGRVGRELSRQLLHAGYDVHGLTRQESVGAAGAISLHRIDGRTETLVRLFQEIQPEIAIHLAALARRNHLTSDVVPLFESNLLYGTQILEASRLSGCKRFITAESILQYAESGEAHPMNLYAATKQAFAELLNYYVGAFAIRAIALVLPTLYSEHENDRKLMTDTTCAAQNGAVLELHTTDVSVDFVHVEDVAKAFVTAAAQLQKHPDNGAGEFKRYCISSGRDVTPLDLVALFEKVGDTKITVRTKDSPGSPRRQKPWHGPALPGWAPAIDLESGIRRMLSTER